MSSHNEIGLPNGVNFNGRWSEGAARVLTKPALDFVAALHRKFAEARIGALNRRRGVQDALDRGENLDFSPRSERVRAGRWTVGRAPADLERRHVEITGPVDRKMMINALNSGADVFMADFEDSTAPTWDNIIDGQVNLFDAVRRTIEMTTPGGKRYVLEKNPATLVVRPRGWHLDEKHLLVDGEPISASLFDFGLYMHHNAAELLARGSGPYFYLPKLEDAGEARLWNEVFLEAQERLGLSMGTVRATVLIETLPAAFQMEEILYELKEHAAGLNAGRWDYIFSAIKTMGRFGRTIFPDRAQITMTVPFMRAYTELLVQTCHRRDAHAIGGMAAFIPSRKDPEINELALAKVRQDKQREVDAGFDGTWVAHPDLVPVAREIFEAVLGDSDHQKHIDRSDVRVERHDLLNFRIEGGRITETGVRNNASVGLLYLHWWLRGQGAVGIDNLMEDTATAEISRAQLWQWIHSSDVLLNDGRPIDEQLVRTVIGEELERLKKEPSVEPAALEQATKLFTDSVTADKLEAFLTTTAYERLN